MTRKRCKKLIMSMGFGAYDAENFITVYKGNGCSTNQEVLDSFREDVVFWKWGFEP